jgi:hypothetical protein
MDLLQKLLASAEKCGNRITSHDCDIITLEPASKVCHNQNHYLKYVIESVGGIATVNPFTALAAMYAGFIYLKTEVLP